MKYLLPFVLLLFVLFESTFQNQETSEINKHKYSDVTTATSSSTINFVGNIINVYRESLTICGVPQDNMVSLQIDEIIESSNSLINPPQKSKTVFFKFLKKPSNLKTGSIINAYAEEYLCVDGIETYFVVTQYEKN